MAINIDSKNFKEIIALNNFEAVRLRPTQQIGQVSLLQEKLPLVVDGKLLALDKIWSPGFMQLLIEILENALDEAKRCKGKMKNIIVKVNLDTNEVTVIDEGLGFHHAAKKHPKTKKNVVRTALEELHAGSNFTDTSTNILGSHGVGSAVVNILSEKFTVETVNRTHYVRFDWKDFNITNEEIRKKKSTDNLGTKITFIPSKEMFPNYKWDIDIITTYLSFKFFLIKNDPIIKKLELKGYFIKDNKEWDIDVTSDFIPKDHIIVSNNFGSIYLWEGYENSCSLSFINGSQCTGIHQKIVNDWCNEYFKYEKAHHFYETLISLNFPSSLMRFTDQNKTKLETSRGEIEEMMKDSFNSKLIRLLSKSEIARSIEESIEERLHNENIGKIRKAQKQSKRKISDKFSPASKYKQNIYITEGLSAAGSVKQARDSETDAVYALKGKVKNARKLSDLTGNAEWLDIMSILEIEPGNGKLPMYEKIIIATDEDFDGQHISSLIISFFHKWFPEIIEKKKLYRIITPLVVCDVNKNRKYFYTTEEFNEFTKINKVTNVNYLKGLGSLSLDDWKNVMSNKILFSIINDRSADRFLEIAFGDNAQKRKNWLSRSG
jgi:DNA gyrase/topoisomerase IV subunit B